MTLEEIKIRRLNNQHLLEPAEMRTVVRDLCGIQAQFFSNAVHALRIRCSDFSEDRMGGQLVKNWTVRGTVHLFDSADTGLFIRCEDGRNYRRNEWTEPSFWNRRDDWSLTPERQSFLTEVVMDALGDGPRTREELKTVCRQSGMTDAEEQSMFHPWGGGVREMCQRGFMHYAAQDDKVFCLTPEYAPVPEKEAMTELARRYFTCFAPATVHDAMYFFGAPARTVREWLEQLPVTEIECCGERYYYIDGGRDYSGCEMPECLFLAGFDQLMMGYEKKESLFLAREHMKTVFTAAGIVRPTVLLRGSVAGWWSRKQNRLTVSLFEPACAADIDAVNEKAGELWHDIDRIDYKY